MNFDKYDKLQVTYVNIFYYMCTIHIHNNNIMQVRQKQELEILRNIWKKWLFFV